MLVVEDDTRERPLILYKIALSHHELYTVERRAQRVT
jgi:hypothetical protein